MNTSSSKFVPPGLCCTDYVGNGGDNAQDMNQFNFSGVIGRFSSSGHVEKINFAAITDGLSNTLLFGEKNVPTDCWGHEGSASSSTVVGALLDPVPYVTGVPPSTAFVTGINDTGIYNTNNLGVLQ